MYIEDTLNFNLLRLSGKTKSLEDKEIKIANYQDPDGIFTLGLLSKKIDFEDILYSLKTKKLYDLLLVENFTKSTLDDIFYLLEIFLRIFKFHPSTYINSRLKNLCFIKIILCNNYEKDASKIDFLFKNLLFFNPSSEDFINRNQLINRNYYNNDIFLDFEDSFEKIFEKIFSLKESKNDYNRIAKNNIELTYKILKEIVKVIFKSENSSLPSDFLKLEKKLENETILYPSLLKHIDYFSLININENTKIVSLYYQANDSSDIINLAKKNSKVKFKSEYIIDSYIYKFSNNPEEFSNFLTYLKDKDYKKYIKFTMILFSHPFIIYNLEVKKLLAGSELIKFVPIDGYAYKKLKKYKEIF